jgi:hypothetical protein
MRYKKARQGGMEHVGTEKNRVFMWRERHGLEG